MNDRAFMVTVKRTKRHWFREDEYKITITDGSHDIVLDNAANSIFVIETNKPLQEQMLYKGTRLPV